MQYSQRSKQTDRRHLWLQIQVGILKELRRYTIGKRKGVRSLKNAHTFFLNPATSLTYAVKKIVYVQSPNLVTQTEGRPSVVGARCDDASISARSRGTLLAEDSEHGRKIV